MKLFLQIALSLSLLVSLPVFAAGDASAGQTKAAVCAACHGADGNSSVPNFPKLSGQHVGYLEKQIKLIRSGARNVPQMAGIATGLSDQDIADLAAYFSSQKRKRGAADKALLEAGQRLFRAGNAKTNVPACMACHGPGGDGIPLAGFPLLAGQHATYTASMLTRFKDGQNWGTNDSGSQIMDAVTLRMTADEIKAVASYIEGLHDVAPSSE